MQAAVAAWTLLSGEAQRTVFENMLPTDAHNIRSPNTEITQQCKREARFTPDWPVRFELFDLIEPVVNPAIFRNGLHLKALTSMVAPRRYSGTPSLEDRST